MRPRPAPRLRPAGSQVEKLSARSSRDFLTGIPEKPGCFRMSVHVGMGSGRRSGALFRRSPTGRRVSSEGRLPAGPAAPHTPQGPSHACPAPSGWILLPSRGPGRTGSDSLFPPPPPPQGASLPFQQVAPRDTSSTCWTTMGGARGALALTRADPGSPRRGRGGVRGPPSLSLPLSRAVTQPRGRCPAPQPGAESVRRP